MRKPSFLLVSIITFVIGFAIVLAWVNTKAPLSKNANPISINEVDNFPILTYCELVNNAQKYDGEILHIQTKLEFHPHGYKFLDKNCYSIEKETAVIFSESNQDEIFAKLTKEIKGYADNPWTSPLIVAKGKFTRIKPNGKTDSMRDNSHLLFEIIEIKKVISYRKIEE